MCIKQALLVKALLNIAIRKRVYISYQRGRQCCSFNSVGQCEGLRTWNGQQEDSTLLFFRNNKVCSLLNAKLGSVGTDKNYIMRSSNFKWHILTVVLLVFSAFTVLAEDALITKQITLNIKAGGLQSEIEGSEWQWNQITNLKLVGELNINDVQFIRQMAGCYYNENGDKYDGHLQHLDIADVEFVGDGSFKAYNGEFYDTAKFESSRVGDYLFSYLDGLQTVVLPSCVVSIYDYAFYQCGGLVSVVMPDGLFSIGSHTFWHCSGLTTLSLPSNLTKIGMNAFRKCNGLTSIYANMTTPAEIDQCAFDENIKANATLYVPNGTYQTYAVANCWRDFLKIKEFDSTGVESVFSTSDVKELSRYTVNGQRLKEPTRGLNIVKYSDGSSRKEIVK